MLLRSASHVERLVHRMLGLTLLVLPLLPCQGEAQSSTPAKPSQPTAARATELYRLTAEVVRKVSGVMREWNPQGPGFLHPEHDAARWKEGTKLIHSLVGEARTGRTILIDRTPALKAAIARAGFGPKEFNAAFDAYIIAQDRIRGEEMAETEEEKRRFAPPLPPGTAKDNVELIRRMETEERLWSIV